jgi:hypothetical protein
MNKNVLARMILIMACAVSLSGCVASVIQDVKVLETPDGREVTCIFSDVGGMDCDWANAK